MTATLELKEKAKPEEAVKLEDLVAGHFFEEDKLIIYINEDKTRMNAIKKIPESGEIGIFTYSIKHDGKIIYSVNNNGHRYLTREKQGDLEDWTNYSSLYNNLMKIYRK